MSGSINNQGHPFHLVDPSPWPFTGAFGALTLTFGAVMYMHGYVGGGLTLVLGFFLVILTMAGWWRDIVREGAFEGHHTREVQVGLRQGMLLFIVSEVMFFFAFFWAFFHSSMNPTIDIVQWPPLGIEVIGPWGVPLLNTVILLTSGATVTWSHHAIFTGNFRRTVEGLALTVFLGCFFLCVQMLEYVEAPFTISDSVYGSTFFMTTGFHGFHVLIGTIFLIVCLVRLYNQEFSREHHVGFESAIWYWHFVDVVWLFLFVVVYWWGGSSSEAIDMGSITS
jgi:cytochrome c oxidase subunit 3